MEHLDWPCEHRLRQNKHLHLPHLKLLLRAKPGTSSLPGAASSSTTKSPKVTTPSSHQRFHITIQLCQLRLLLHQQPEYGLPFFFSQTRRFPASERYRAACSVELSRWNNIALANNMGPTFESCYFAALGRRLYRCAQPSLQNLQRRSRCK